LDRLGIFGKQESAAEAQKRRRRSLGVARGVSARGQGQSGLVLDTLHRRERLGEASAGAALLPVTIPDVATEPGARCGSKHLGPLQPSTE